MNKVRSLLKTRIAVSVFLCSVFLVFALPVYAETRVPNTFVNGTPADAEEVNENFDALENAINSIPVGPVGAPGPQGIAGGQGLQGSAGANGTDGTDGSA
ncbi:MAG: hypothetical protein ACJ04P_07185, partial [Halioglobus sp.]